ncbi:MAG: hypothetical protein ACLUI3_11620 [Christensenellales bacterium]
MDDDPMERARITIFTEQATLAWPVSGEPLRHADGYAGARRFFRRDGARASVLDAALLVVSWRKACRATPRRSSLLQSEKYRRSSF